MKNYKSYVLVDNRTGHRSGMYGWACALRAAIELNEFIGALHTFTVAEATIAEMQQWHNRSQATWAVEGAASDVWTEDTAC